MRALKQLNTYILAYKWRFLTGILFVTVSNIFAIFPAQVIRYAFDSVEESIVLYKLFDGLKAQETIYNGTVTTLIIYAGLVLLFATIKGLFMFFMRQTIIVMSRHIEYDLKNDIYQQYQLLDMTFYKQNNTGDLMNRISEDVGKVRMYLGPAIMYSINLVVLFVLVITTMIRVNPMLTFYVLLPLPILSVSIYYVSNLINRKSEKVQRQLSVMSTFVQEAFSGIRVLKAYNRENDSYNNFKAESEKSKDVNLNLVRINAVFHPMMILLIGISTVLTIFIGGKLAIAGEVSTGNIAEFVIYVNMLTWPVAAIGWVTSLVQRASASQERINEFLNAEPKVKNTSDKEIDIKGSISFQNVTFTYPDSNITALKNLTFEVKPGESIAILGKTGSGKSTIAHLLTRHYDPQRGEILIDGLSIKEYNLSYLRSQIGYVPQDVFLFSDTIANNIKFGQFLNNEIDDEEIYQAAKDADIYDNVIEFNKGFDTLLGERGITLSGGQKQRLSIARAILGKPKILIFDDCLSAVDTETEERIISSLKGIMEARTTLIISHRISSVKHANKILIIEDGQVVESGNHNDLMEQQGIYFELYYKQQSEESTKFAT